MIGFIVDSHRQCFYSDHPVVDLYFIQFEVEMQHTLYGTDEVTHIVMSMESNEVCSQQTLQNLGTLRKNTEEFVRRERDMMEITDT